MKKEKELQLFIQKCVEEAVKKEMDNLLKEAEEIIERKIKALEISKVLHEKDLNWSLKEYIEKLGVFNRSTSSGSAAVEFAMREYTTTGIKPGKELYSKMLQNGLSEMSLRRANIEAFYQSTPVYQEVFRMYTNVANPPTNTQFIVLAGNYYRSRFSTDD